MNELLEATTTRTNPGIDPSLHIWGWEIVVYLFLGGLVAGIFVLAAALELKSGEKPRGAALRLMPLAALGLLSVGMLALWLDLAHRLWAWRFYLFFHATSPMSWGAWILVLIYPVGLLLGLGSMSEGQRAWLLGRTPGALKGLVETLFRWADGSRRGILLTSIAMGASLGIYTGLLLGTMPSRILWNSAVLGPLFLASGISTGAALLLLLPLEESERRTLVRWDAVAIVAELVLIALMIVFFSGGGREKVRRFVEANVPKPPAGAEARTMNTASTTPSSSPESGTPSGPSLSKSFQIVVPSEPSDTTLRTPRSSSPNLLTGRDGHGARTPIPLQPSS